MLWAALLVLIVVLVINSEPKRDANGQITKSGSLSVFDIRVNDCFDGVADGQTTREVTAKPCAQPHDAQMIEKLKQPGGGYPGEQSRFSTGGQKCQQDEQARLSRSPLAQRLKIFILVPNQQSWEDGNHTVACAVVDQQGGKLTGPIDGTG